LVIVFGLCVGLVCGGWGRTVVIEDSEIGLTAAKAAGMKCIVTKSSYTANEDFTHADAIVAELGEASSSQAVAFDTIRSLALKA
jgi:beta-phosphoglucomutase-like phosphatase (HAD superfamily)